MSYIMNIETCSEFNFKLPFQLDEGIVAVQQDTLLYTPLSSSPKGDGSETQEEFCT